MMRGCRRCRDALEPLWRWLAARARPWLLLRPAPASPPPILPAGVAALLAEVPEREALLAAVRIETGPSCPAMTPLIRLAETRHARALVTIHAEQGSGGEARRVRIDGMIATGTRRDERWCP